LKFFASGLLFDNDGVLVDSHEAARIGWEQWATEFAPHFDWDTPENAGVRAEDKVRELVAAELFESANNRINELEQETAHLTAPLPGAVELLTSLRAGTWTVCTSANTNLGKARLMAAGLPLPSELVTGDHVKNGKPYPDPYLLGAERLGFDPADCVVFEDAIAGVEAGIEAGAGLVVGVSERALKSAADIVVKDLTGITFDGETLFIPDKIRLR
jgi:mannitol-1-/sugar-/sorbitol-6-phosphatase